MSTYYCFRCADCKEQGGFFSRQMWGWGNCDIFTNFKFCVAHAHCSALEILPEWDDRWADDAEERKWAERLRDEEGLADDVWPRATEWKKVTMGWEASHEWWLTEELPRILKHAGIDSARSNETEDG